MTVHRPFHEVSKVIHPQVSPSALLSSLVSSPSTPLYTALILLTPGTLSPSLANIQLSQYSMSMATWRYCGPVAAGSATQLTIWGNPCNEPPVSISLSFQGFCLQSSSLDNCVISREFSEYISSQSLHTAALPIGEETPCFFPCVRTLPSPSIHTAL